VSSKESSDLALERQTTECCITKKYLLAAKNHTKKINKFYGQNLEVINLDVSVHTVTYKLYNVKATQHVLSTVLKTLQCMLPVPWFITYKGNATLLDA
jgi:hypothetical protein